MKKVLLLPIIIIFMSFVACKKNRVCECKYKYTSSNPASTSSGFVKNETITTTYTNMKKSDAKYACQNNKNSNTSTFPTATYITTDDYTCKLK